MKQQTSAPAKLKKVAIVGATGFTGSELVRLLLSHPGIAVNNITSESKAGQPFYQVHPQFEGLTDIVLQPSAKLDPSSADLIFLALPHGVSMDYVSEYYSSGTPIVDLSGDFRLQDGATYELWYGKAHTFQEAIPDGVYGLPELNAARIATANLIANPGCYPTSAILGLAPLVKAGIAGQKDVVIDAKSGVTGAGIKPKPGTHFSQVHDNFTAYGLKRHRHTIEIEQTLGQVSGKALTVQFTPHLLPLDRGILSTMYLTPSRDVDQEELDQLYGAFYETAPFVRLRSTLPALKEVRGTNYCDLFVTFDDRTGRIIVLSAIDNLMKGAAGQAVQNMNLRFGWEETMGLKQVPLKP